MTHPLQVNAFPPAVDGVGRAPITDPDALMAFHRLLADHPMIRGADEPGLADRLPRVARINRYVAGHAIMSAGEHDRWLGIVLSGRCAVWSPNGAAEAIGGIGPGGLVGEMSALTGAPRSATVGALRDTVVAEFDLQALCPAEDGRTMSAIYAWLARFIARRASGTEQRPPAGTHLVVLGLHDHVGLELAERLADAGRAQGECWTVRTRSAWPGLPTARQLEAVERDHDVVVFVGDRHDRSWTEHVVRQADRVLVVADALGAADPTAFDRLARAARAPHSLVLIQPHGIERATNTARWLAARDPEMHLHVRRDHPDDLARCLRLVTGRGRGVAFAGASSRGMGYVGVMRAFEELGLSPDIVSGNSSGAMTAACVAMGFDSARALTAHQEAFEALRPRLGKLTLPLVSLLTGRHISRTLRRWFGDVRLEDLIVPCVLTAVDLSTLSLVELKTGPLWRALRASSSLPAYYPPVITDERVLIDGGVLDNMPVEPLRAACRDGFIMLGDLSQDPEGMTDMARYGTALSGWRLLLSRLWPFGRRRTYPVMPEVLFRTACIASLRNQAELLRRTEPNWLHMRPETPPVGLFGITDEALPRLLEDARRATTATLETSALPAVQQALAGAPRPGRATRPLPPVPPRPRRPASRRPAPISSPICSIGIPLEAS